MKTNLISLLSAPLLAMIPSAFALAATPVFECGTVITEPGEYVVTQDILGCMSDGLVVVGTSDVTLDLQGHTVSCASESYDVRIWGVVVVFSENVHVKNGVFSGCRDGALAVQSEGTKFTGIHGTANWGAGIVAWEASNTTIKRSHADYNGFAGIVTAFSSNTTIKRNRADNNGTTGIEAYVNTGTKILANVSVQHYERFGIVLDYEHDAHVALNTVKYNDAGIVVFGKNSGHILRGNLVAHNTVAGISLTGYTDVDDEGNPIIVMPADNCITSNMVMGNGRQDMAEHVVDDLGNFFVPPDATCQNKWQRNWYVSGEGPEDCLGPPMFNRRWGVDDPSALLPDAEDEQ